MENIHWDDGLFDEDFPPNFSFGVDLSESLIDDDSVVPESMGDDPSVQFQKELNDFIREGKAKQTISKERSDLNRFYLFLRDIAEPYQEIEAIPAKNLDNLLCRYFMRRKN